MSTRKLLVVGGWSLVCLLCGACASVGFAADVCSPTDPDHPQHATVDLEVTSTGGGYDLEVDPPEACICFDVPAGNSPQPGRCADEAWKLQWRTSGLGEYQQLVVVAKKIKGKNSKIFPVTVISSNGLRDMGKPTPPVQGGLGKNFTYFVTLIDTSTGEVLAEVDPDVIPHRRK